VDICQQHLIYQFAVFNPARDLVFRQTGNSLPGCTNDHQTPDYSTYFLFRAFEGGLLAFEFG